MSSVSGFEDVEGLNMLGVTLAVWFGIRLYDQGKAVKTSNALKEIFLEFKDFSHDFIPDERIQRYNVIWKVMGPMSHGKGLVWKESLEKNEALECPIVVIHNSPKNVNNESESPSIRYCDRKRMFRRIAWKENLEDDTGEQIHIGVHSQGDCVMLPLMIMKMLRQLLLLKKTPSLPSSTPPG
ncbi:hypothetical protein Tco_1532015 [Tanacetum coccineum]